MEETSRRTFLGTVGAAATSSAAPGDEQVHEHQDVPSESALRVKALESLLVEKGIVDAAALDAIVLKQGVFTMVFHPHGWIKNDQLVDLIDYAVAKHGKKIKFLTFREALEHGPSA